jgi:hypothetical protein
MADFLTRTAARVMGRSAPIRPRLPSLYEPPAASFALPPDGGLAPAVPRGARPEPEHVTSEAAARPAPARPFSPSALPLTVPAAAVVDMPPQGARTPAADSFADLREPGEAARPGPESEPLRVAEVVAGRLLVPIPLASDGRFERDREPPRSRSAYPGEPPTLARRAPPPVDEAGGRHAGPAPIVRVTIGRIEVRATPPAGAAALPPRRESSLRRLDDYLRGGRRERP